MGTLFGRRAILLGITLTFVVFFIIHESGDHIAESEANGPHSPLPLRNQNKPKGVANDRSGNFVDSKDVGFYIQAYNEPVEGVKRMLGHIRWFFPDSPITLLSDHGPVDYGPLCEFFPPCTYVYDHIWMHADRSFPPHNYTCSENMRRILSAVKAMNTPYAFLWETDNRALGPLQRPPHDLMQMKTHNLWSDQTREYMFRKYGNQIKISPGGWSSTGGTVFNAKKILAASRAGFYRSFEWREINENWNIADLTEDACLLSTAILCGLTIDGWDEYVEADGREPKNCRKCWNDCKASPQRTLADRARVPASLAFLPDIDVCVLQQCHSPVCPPFIHKVKRMWEDF